MTDPNHEPAPPAVTPDAAAPLPTRRTEDRLNVPKSSCKAARFLPGNTAYVVDHDPAGVVQKPVLVLLKAKPENRDASGIASRLEGRTADLPG